MSQLQSNSNRLTALDGLRGLSSLLVLATHLKLDIPQITTQIPFMPLRFLLRTIMNTGNISVGFFFILCGFLMAYLYENPKSYVYFAQKRYLRIFTVLIVSVVISFAVVTLGMNTIPMLLFMLLLVPLVFRIGYAAALSILKHKFIFWFFILIISSQIIVAFINYFIVFRIGAQEFFSLPKALYTSFMFATNYTLTFIFGDYIPMVDGGYWSLVSEVMFYLVYPFIAWHIIKPLQRLSRYYWIAWFMVSMIACYGFSILFKNLLAFNTAHIHFAHFFTVGMMIALAYKSKSKFITKLITFFQTPVGQVVSILCYGIPVASAFWLGYISNPFTQYIVAYGLAPLMGLAVIALLAQKNYLTRLFNTRIFLALGTISFPLYVIHSPIVNVLWKTIEVQNTTDLWLLYLVLAVCLSIGAAYYLHIVIERFYFIATRTIQDPNPSKHTESVPSLKKLFFASLVICMVSIFVAFQQNFSLLSLVRSHDTSTLVIEGGNINDYSLLSNDKIRGSFLAYENKLGIVTMHLKHVGILKEETNAQDNKRSNVISFRIKEKGDSTWYHESQHIGWKISSEEPYPFGFPEFENSKNKWFEFEIESKRATEKDHTIILTPNKYLQTVYKIPKSVILKEPSSILLILQNKIYGAFSQLEAQIVMGIYAISVLFIWILNKMGLKSRNS